MSEEIKNEEKAIEIRRPGFIKDVDDLNNVADIMIKSGLFKDITAMQQAAVKILAGQEYGIGPFAAMKSIHIIQGNATLAAGLMASKVKAHPRYDYRVKTLDDTGCIIQFFEDKNGKWEHIGDSKFDESDAKQAGLFAKDNWRKYPRNMYFSRAISNGVRFFCPDVFYGLSVYTPDEIDPNWIESDVITVEEGDMNKQPAHNPEPKEPEPKAKVVRPMPPEVLSEALAKKSDGYRKAGFKADEKLKKQFVIDMSKLCSNDDNIRHEVCKYLFGSESSKEIDDANIKSGLDWMNFGQTNDGDWVPGAHVLKELQAVVDHISGEIHANGDAV